MAVEWFCQVSGEQLGPLSARQLKTMAQRGQLTPDSQVRQGSNGKWVPAGRVKGLFSSPDSSEAWSDSSEVPMAQPAAQSAAAPTAKRAPRAPANSKRPGQPPKATPLPQAQVAPPVVPQAQVAPARVPPTRAAMSPPLPVAPRPSAAGPAMSDAFGIVTDDTSPTARVTGRSSGGTNAAGTRKKKNTTVVIALAGVLVGLVALAIAIPFIMRDSGEKPPETASAATPEGPTSEDMLLGGGSQAPDPDEPTEPTGSGNVSTRALTAPTAEAVDDGWQDASTQTPIRRGDIEVTLRSASIGIPRLVRPTGRGAKPKQDFLIIRVGLRNTNRDLKLEYKSWSLRGPLGSTTTLKDNLGNPYFLKSFTGATPEGQLQEESIYPNDSIEDVLVFQEPIVNPRVTYLRLTLPAMAFGERGLLKFEIPKTMLSTLDETTSDEAASDETTGGDQPDDFSSPDPNNADPAEDPGEEPGDPLAEPGDPAMRQEQPGDGDAEKPQEDEEDIDELRRDYPDLFGGGDGGNGDGGGEAEGFEGKFDMFAPKQK